jgi:hypothetical protein
MVYFLSGAISCCPLYLLLAPPQKDAASIRARLFDKAKNPTIQYRFKTTLKVSRAKTGNFKATNKKSWIG